MQARPCAVRRLALEQGAQPPGHAGLRRLPHLQPAVPGEGDHRQPVARGALGEGVQEGVGRTVIHQAEGAGDRGERRAEEQEVEPGVREDVAEHEGAGDLGRQNGLGGLPGLELEETSRWHARGVDQAVDRAEALFGGAADLLHVVPPGHVAGQEERLDPAPAQALEDLRRRLLAADQHELRLYRRAQPLRERETDAAGSAGDQVDASRPQAQGRGLGRRDPLALEALHPAGGPAPGDGFLVRRHLQLRDHAIGPDRGRRRLRSGQIDVETGDAGHFLRDHPAGAEQGGALRVERLAPDHVVDAARHDGERERRAPGPVRPGLRQGEQGEETRSPLLHRAVAPEVDDGPGEPAALAQPGDQLVKGLGRVRHGAGHLAAQSPQALREQGSQPGTVTQDQPGAAVCDRHRGRQQARLLPGREPEPVRRIAALGEALRLRSGRRLPVRRRRIDPEAPPLEGIGGQRHAPPGLAPPEGFAVARDSGQPELAQGRRGRGPVGLAVIGVRKGGDRGHGGILAAECLEGDAPQGVARADLEKDPAASGAEGADPVAEAHGAHHVLGPVAGIGRLPGGHPGAGGVRDQRDARRTQLERGGDAQAGIQRGLEHPRVEGPGGAQAAADHAAGREVLLQPDDLLFRAGRHAEGGTVDRGEGEPSAQQGRDLALRQGDGQHRPGGQPFEEARPCRHQLQRAFQGEDAGQAGGGVLADAVAEQRLGPDSPAHPELRQGVFHGEQRRVEHGRAVQRIVLRPLLATAQHAAQVEPAAALLPSPGGEQEPAQIGAETGRETAGAFVERLAKRRLPFVEPAGHPRVVVTDAREQERHRGLAIRRNLGTEEPARLLAAQQAHGFGAVAGDQDTPVGEGPAPALERVRHVGQRQLRMRLQMAGEVAARRLQSRGAARREAQELPGARRGGRRTCRHLLQHHMRVGAADAEGAHPGAPRHRPGRPVAQPVVDKKRRAREVDARIRPLEVQARRDLPMLQGEHRLDQAGDAGRRVEVPDVRLDRADGAELPALGGEGLGERRDLDDVAERCPRAVRLDVLDALRIDVAQGVGGGDHLGLAVDAGGGVVQLERAVVVHREALDHRVDGVAVGEGVAQAFEDDQGDPVAEHGAVRVRVEGAAAAVGGIDAFLEQVPRARRRGDRNPSGQRHVALVAEQALAGEADGHQRGGAGGLHVDARPLEVQLVGGERRQEVLVVADAQLERPDAPHQLAVRDQVVDQIAGDVRAGEDADRACEDRGIVAGVLEGLPGVLQEQPVLGVHGLGLARGEAEQLGVEQIHAVRHAARPHIAGIAQRFGGDPGGPQLLLREEGDRADSVAQIAPVRLEARRPGHPQAHADDGDPIQPVLLFHLRLHCAHSSSVGRGPLGARGRCRWSAAFCRLARDCRRSAAGRCPPPRAERPIANKL